jgi:hypothetical protein
MVPVPVAERVTALPLQIVVLLAVGAGGGVKELVVKAPETVLSIDPQSPVTKQ